MCYTTTVFIGERSSFMPTQSGAFNPLGGDVQTLPEEQFPPWVEVLAYKRVEFMNGKETLSFETVSPTQHRLTQEMKEDLLRSAIACVQMDDMTTVRQKFFFRIRDKSAPGFVFRDENDDVLGTAVTTTTEFLNCYCLFTQRELTLSGENSPTNKGLFIVVVFIVVASSH
jgi:hypothetical protein